MSNSHTGDPLMCYAPATAQRREPRTDGIALPSGAPLAALTAPQPLPPAAHLDRQTALQYVPSHDAA